MTTIKEFFFISALWLMVSCTASQENEAFRKYLEHHPDVTSYDLVIINGKVVDGTGKAAFRGDMLISHDSIAFVGQVDTTQITVQQIIDAEGKVVAPGFIDTHAHGSPLETPAFANFLSMGATTIALGKDGSSPEDLSGWMQKVTDTVPGVNIAMFSGHGTLRMQSGIAYDKAPSEQQLEKMGKLLEEQLQLGCFGMSSGLEYVPGMYAPAYELEYLAKILGKEGKLFTSHIRNEDDGEVDQAIREILALSDYCPVHISHLKVVYGKGADRAQEILSLLDSARNKSHQVTADIYPYTASYTGISIVFPEWALPPNDYPEVVRTRRKELEDFLRNKIKQRNGPEATLLGTKPFAGKTLGQLAKEYNKPFEDVLIDNIKPGGASGAYFVMNDTLQARLIEDVHTMICSDGSATSRHPRGHGTFARIIEDFVVRDSILSLEEAVRKMTSLPAATMKINDRGTLKPGKKADIIIFSPAQVRATATYENPFQLAEGFEYVVVNGQVSINKGILADQRAGKLLKQ